MYIDKYFKNDGYYAENGCYYENAIDFIQCEIFNFCCCGCPEESLKYIRDILRLIKIKDDVKNYNKELFDKLHGYFHSEGEKYTIYYLLDFLELTEHGGAVPGWLTKKGRDILEDLEQLNLDEL